MPGLSVNEPVCLLSETFVPDAGRSVETGSTWMVLPREVALAGPDGQVIVIGCAVAEVRLLWRV